MFLTQLCLTHELTLDLLEKYHNPEKLKTCLVTDDDDLEVKSTFELTLEETLHVYERLLNLTLFLSYFNFLFFTYLIFFFNLYLPYPPVTYDY